MKTCKGCGQEHPEENFPIQHGYRTGKCRGCKAVDIRRWREANPDLVLANRTKWEKAHPKKAKAPSRPRASDIKRVASLKPVRIKPSPEQAKEKRRAYDAQRRLRDPKRARRWQDANPERVTAQQTAYRAAHLERLTKRQADARSTDEYRAKLREYRNANPEMFKAKKARRRARELGAEGEYNAADQEMGFLI